MKTVVVFVIKAVLAAVIVCLLKAYTKSEMMVSMYTTCPMDQVVNIIVVAVVTMVLLTILGFYTLDYCFREEPPPAPVCRFIYHKDEREDFLRSDKYQAFELQAMAHKALSVTSIPVDHLGEYTEWSHAMYLYSFTPMALMYLSKAPVAFERFQEGKITKQNVLMRGI